MKIRGNNIECKSIIRRTTILKSVRQGFCQDNHPWFRLSVGWKEIKMSMEGFGNIRRRVEFL